MLHSTAEEYGAVNAQFDVHTQPSNMESARFVVLGNVGEDHHGGETDCSVSAVNVKDAKQAHLGHALIYKDR